MNVETPPRAVPLGLSTEEVRRRHAEGLSNHFPLPTSRSYAQIFRENVFTFINCVLFGLGLALCALGRLSDAVVSVGVVSINVLVSVVQEVRAKRTLDRIALLAHPHATVLRDGAERVVHPGEIVVGDVLVARPGDQVVVDGQVVGDGRMDVDESLLTGESDHVSKRPGDAVYSGSFCVAGTALYEAQQVGAQSLANRLTVSARTFRRTYTPLQQEVNLAIRVILLLAVYLEILLAASAIIQDIPLLESVQMSVVIAGLVPNGLFVAIALAYAMGAVRIAGRGALVQQSNAIESLSNVNVLCLDKTGTLTANRLAVAAVHPVGRDEAAARALLGDYAASTPTGNRTTEALAAACGGQVRAVSAEVPFSSERKWSALALADGAAPGVYVLGAPEILQSHVAADPALWRQVDDWAREGWRVVLFAGAPPETPLADAGGAAVLPAGLTPLALVGFVDELRPEARETLASFAAAGIQVKIISGDNPRTVAALAQQVGLGANVPLIAGPDLAKLDAAEFARVAEETVVFGRITPQQKEQIVRALRRRGHHVAMIGDGVNDVLALKQAHLGIAMLSGSQATRAVADLVLLHDSFAVLPHAFREGQRILNGMQDILRLFLTRVLYVTLLITSVGIMGGFPFLPKQASLLALLTVGLPSLALAAWAQAGPMPRRSLVRSLFEFVLPAALTLSLVGLAFYGGYLHVLLTDGWTKAPETIESPAFREALLVAQTALTTLTVFCGLLLILFVEPPGKRWAIGEDHQGDWRPTALALVLFLAYLVILTVPELRIFFDLAPLAVADWAFAAAVALLWAVGLHLTWRWRLLSRFFDLNDGHH